MYIPVELCPSWEVGVDRWEERGGDAWGYDGVGEVVEGEGEKNLMDMEGKDWEGEIGG
jgi:hypothetical protein